MPNANKQPIRRRGSWYFLSCMLLALAFPWLAAAVPTEAARSETRHGKAMQVPPAPTAVAGDAHAIVTVTPWTENGDSIIGFQIRRSSIEGQVESNYDFAVQQRIDGLSNGTAYTFSVRAYYVTEVYGPWSPESAPVTPVAVVPPSFTMADVSMVEGDAGSTEMVFTLVVVDPPSSDLDLRLHTETGTANDWDFNLLWSVDTVLPQGQTSLSVAVEVLGDVLPEADETFILRVTNSGGSLTYAEATGTILNDDGEVVVPFGGREDRFIRSENGSDMALAVLGNDLFDADVLVGGRLEVAAAPALGSASVSDNGTPDDASDDRILYTPPSDWVGEETLTYRVCDVADRCYEAKATVVVSMVGMLYGVQGSHTGRVINRASGLRDLPSVRFEATPLVKADPEILDLDVDPAPLLPWDNSLAGTSFRLRSLPQSSDGGPRRWRVNVLAGPFTGQGIGLYVGIDDDGDGEPDAGEVRCVSAMLAPSENCEIAVEDPGTGAPEYWVLVHNTTTRARTADVYTMEVPIMATDGTLVATGPGKVAAGASFDVWASWNEPKLLPRDYAGGFVRVLSGAGDELDLIPVIVYRSESVRSGVTALQSGSGRTLSLAAGMAENRMFIDVPAGASNLTVTTSANGNIDLYLAHAASPSSPTILDAPARANAQASALGATGNESLTISGAQLLPGRWYVTPVNMDSAAVDVTVTATITGVAPVVRSGSYFNAARSGHGLFLYPAADQWVGIWYTFLPDSTPTWYYLQGPAPGANGIWSGTLYRSAWLGTRNVLTPVGVGTVTPSGNDAFMFTHEVAGVTGSEPMAALGRGCPSIAGVPQDVSSHWFDPAHAGVGYSVQMFQNYEFYTAFVYDAQGIARFLVGERSSFGGEQATLRLDQITGFCPTCIRNGDTIRIPVGALNRTFANGTLSSIAVDAIYTGTVPGAWTGNDIVQPLGGPGTTQGCDL